MEELRRNVNRLESDVQVVKDDVAELKEAAVEHRVRLQNGSSVFGDYSERIAKVEERTTPKPVSAVKIIGITLSVALACAGALWALAMMIRDRPTVEQLDSVMESQEEAHEEAGHKAMREDVGHIQQEQGAQRVLIESVQTEQRSADKKLDVLIERIPAPPKPRSKPRRRPR